MAEGPHDQRPGASFAPNRADNPSEDSGTDRPHHGNTHALFLSGSIMRHVLTMTSTGAIGLVSIFAAELIDVLFLSMLGDIEVVAAIGYAGPLVFLTVACAIGLSIATVSLVSPAVGAGNRPLAKRLSASVQVYTFIASAALSIGLLPFLPMFLSMMGAKGRTAELAYDYLLVVVPSLPPLAIAMACSAVLRSLGDAQRAMYVTLGAAIATVILDPLLIFGAQMGLMGAAWSAVIARIMIMLIALNSLWRIYGMIELPTLAGLRQDLRPVLTIAIPAIATNAATPIANAIVTAAFAPFGDAAVAGWAVIGRIQPVAFAFVFAMSGSVGPIIGQNFGARLHGRMRQALNASFKVVAIYTAIAWIVLALCAETIINLFKATNDGAMLIRLYCYWMAPIFGFQGALFIANAVLNTLGRPRVATALNWARAILGTLPFTWIGGIVAGSAGVLLGNLLGGVIFGTIAIAICYQLTDQIAGNSHPQQGQRLFPLRWSWIGGHSRLVAMQNSTITAVSDGEATNQPFEPSTAKPSHSAVAPAHTGDAPSHRTSLRSDLRTRLAALWSDEGRTGLPHQRYIADDLNRLRGWAIGLPRVWKRAILAISDFLILAASVWLAISLRYGEFYMPPTLEGVLLLLAAPAIGVATFAWFGLYRLVTRYITIRGSGQLLKCIAISALIWAVLALVTGASWLPRTVILALYPLIGGSLIFLSRQAYAIALRSVGVRVRRHGPEPRPVVIYGAGRTGVQLLDALHSSGESRVAGFLDDSGSLPGQYAGNVKIYRPEKLTRLIEREGVKEVILALPESRRRERREILKWLQNFPVRVKTLPDMADFAAGRATVADLRPVDVEDLLGRDPVPADPVLLGLGIRDRAVLVSGAGGSIGSELVRQIIRLGPSRLVLLDLSEEAIYQIGTQLEDFVSALPPGTRTPEVVTVLGSVLDRSLVRTTLKTNSITTIFHAAAYKHVPIVESNPVAGLTNNTFGTAVLAEAARDLGVERFVLISTDKAVRPTNVMGASKRLAELILQSHAADPACRTVFTMVRFGNVLDSSGSVVRRFKQQIQSGGPVTVTHKEVVRYFMSIPEAAGLVLQAGGMASGGEVFVLDMGEPVKIDDLARTMIRLMGLEVRDEQNSDGDVAIVYVGLRPGEKLYEELLIGENTTPTQHPLIRRSSEPHLPADRLERELAVLKAAMSQGGLVEIAAVLERTVEGYSTSATQPTGSGSASVEPSSRTLH